MKTASAPSTAPALPRRDPLESDVTFAFRLLNYLESTGAIEPTQNSIARKKLSDELAKGLIASLMEFAIDKDITKGAAAVSVVAPRPAPLAKKAARNLAVAVESELKSELKKKACRFFWDQGVPALMTVGAV